MNVVGLGAANADLAACWVKGREKEVKEEKRGSGEVMAISGWDEPASIACWKGCQGDSRFLG